MQCSAVTITPVGKGRSAQATCKHALTSTRLVVQYGAIDDGGVNRALPLPFQVTGIPTRCKGVSWHGECHLSTTRVVAVLPSLAD